MNITLGQAYSFTQIGQRPTQQDARFPDDDKMPNRQRFFVVCDGVGGVCHGAEAAQMVCQTIGKELCSKDFNNDFTNNDFGFILNKAYIALEKSYAHSNYELATTLTFAAFHTGGCTLAHIGDSRIYVIRPTLGIIYRSDDHSLVNQMVHSGIITAEEANEHPQSNIVTRVMEPVERDQNRACATVARITNLKANDSILLCSDGVTHCLDDEQIAELISQNDTDGAIRLMADMCKNSPDNNTAILIPIINASNENGEQEANEVSMGNDTLRSIRNNLYIEEISSITNKKNKINSLYQLIKHLFQ